MRGSVWVYLMCYMTTTRGRVIGKQKVYGYAEVRQVSTTVQQKLQYYKAINKALAVYRSNNHLDSDTEVGYTHLNDGIIYEGSKNGVQIKKRKKTILTGSEKREVRHKVLRDTKAKGESGKHTTKEEQQKMYSKKPTKQQLYKAEGKTYRKNKSENKINNIKKEINNLTPQKRKKLIKLLSK